MALVALLALAPPAFAKVKKAKKPPREPWLLFPVDVRAFQYVSSEFGLRKLNRRVKQHRGVDLVAPKGAWVVAAREGMISSVGRDRACGWFVRLEHANGWHTVYCHLKRDPRLLGVAEGAIIPAQSVLGEVGSTGHSTGPHLHFSLLDPAGRTRDPLASLYTPRETYALLTRGVAR